MENNLSDKIDQYLDGKMNAQENAAFEKELSSNETLRQQVEMQTNLRQGIDRLNLKSNISSQFRKMTIKNKIYKWGVATIAIAAIGTASYFGYQQLNGNAADNYELPALNEQGKAEWSDADKNLPTQLFSIDPAKDTVLETEGGIIFAVPAGAFLGANGKITLEVREALNPMDIINGGLSTTSDGEQLETGGMFYLNARSGEQSLKINPAKPVYANVPTNEIKPGMMLFTGERNADGSINWKNPKPMEKQLIPVDINSLDFYPNGFKAKVAELGFDANDKRVTDSIYYSYSGRKNNPKDYYAFDDANGSVFDTENEKLWYEDSLMAAIQAKVPSSAKAYELEKKITSTNKLSSPDGKALFKQNCMPCHNASEKKSTGGLMGVLDRIPGGDWKYNFVHNSQKVIASGDGYARAKWLEWNKSVMTPFPQLKNEEIDAVLNYANGGDFDPEKLEINPARISAIWNPKFQNTLIATKEFEERLQVIFKTGDPDLLDLYVNNLDKKMYEIDSMAWHNGGGYEFEEFYNRHDGGIAIKENHMKKLQEYFNKKREATESAAQKTYNDRIAKETKADKTHSDVISQQSENDSKRNSENFQKEFDVNLTEAYKQLGLEKPKPLANAYYAFAIPATGWNNVDKYVLESTVNRTTLDYTDPYSGKKAVIKYEALSITVDNESNYEQVKVYLIPDSLNSFMRVSKNGAAYEEKLNQLFKYTIVVVAQKDKKWFWVEQSNAKPGATIVTLNEIKESDLRVNLNHSFTKQAGQDFRNDLDAMIEQHEYSIQLKQRQKQEEIDEAIMPVIFPFYSSFLRSTPASPFGAPNFPPVNK